MSVLACVWLSACKLLREPEPSVRVLPARTIFVAMERDFQDYRRWGSLQLEHEKAQGTTHAAGSCRVYVNALPAPAAKDFPVGTVIVKEVVEPDHVAEAPAEAPGQIFAMVKRGAGFNARGAKGWEWFEIKEREDHSFGIVWRGVGAPKGEDYGGDPLGTCNACHGTDASYDYVKTAKPQHWLTGR